MAGRLRIFRPPILLPPASQRLSALTLPFASAPVAVFSPFTSGRRVLGFTKGTCSKAGCQPEIVGSGPWMETFLLTDALPAFIDTEAPMRHRTLVTAIPFMLLGPGAAYAQTSAATPPTTTPGAPGVVAPQPGSTGAPAAATGTPTGRPADTITNNSAAGGNAGQPSRAIPQGGGGGGSK